MTRVEGLEEVKLALKLVRLLRNALHLPPPLSLAHTFSSIQACIDPSLGGVGCACVRDYFKMLVSV